MSSSPLLGALLADMQAPAELLAAAAAAEQVGFDELWVAEDYFCGGGIASAAALLASTALPVGLGVAPVGGRHPAILAVELATLAGMFPGRLHAGLGAGVPDLAAQIGTRLHSPLGAVRDTLRGVRTLLSGRALTTSNSTFSASAVELMHPPAVPPPLYLGAAGPKMLRLSGAEANGTVLSVLSGVDYVRWARARLDEGGAGPEHRLVAYVLCAVSEDTRTAYESLRELVAHAALPSPRNALSEVQGFAEEAERLAALGFETAIPQIPDRWLEGLTVAGTVTQCTDKILALLDAGVDTLALCFPTGSDGLGMLELAGRELLPRVRAEVARAPEAVK